MQLKFLLLVQINPTVAQNGDKHLGIVMWIT